jgi:hypothetical protein
MSIENQMISETSNALVASVQEQLGGFVKSRQDALETTLKNIFLTSQEENRIQVARRVMGHEIAMLSDEEVQIYLTEFQYLIESWMNEYERNVFKGKTLREVLQEG